MKTLKLCLITIWSGICHWRKDVFMANRYLEARVLVGISYLCGKHGKLYRATYLQGLRKLGDLMLSRLIAAGRHRFWDPEVVTYRYFKWMKGMR